MVSSDKERLSELLRNIALALDIPDHVYEDATLKYEDIGLWLAAEDSELKPFSPEIYPQGSFRLGTAIRPVSEKDDYDVDLVCHLELQKEHTTQKDLKQRVGDRLRKREDIAKMLEESRRCWTLDYPPEDSKPHFHMDVLPAIPNRERPPTAILITDTELIRWQKSNPKAYAEWFYERMEVIFRESKAILAKSLSADIEEVPDWQVRTPLQIAIQILKRHRDIYFRNDLENRPVSIIVTTLAARAYNSQANIRDALLDIVRIMPGFIEKRNGRWWVENPVDPDENFADKWNEHPERLEAFKHWLQKVQDDFSSISQRQALSEAVNLLVPILGQRPTVKAATDLGLKMPSGLPASATPQTQIPALGDIQHCLSPIWPVQERYKARVTGSVYRQQGGRKLWGLVGKPVPKRVWLKFTVATNTPRPYDVRWQVVNTGKEAIEARQLRGDFYESDESDIHVRWESTLYNGTHWIEAFIIKDGICVARSRHTTVRVRW